MDDALLAELAAIVGPERFISGDPVRLEPFGHDEVSGGAGHTRLPDAVVFPETEEEIRQIVTLADLHRFPVTVTGWRNRTRRRSGSRLRRHRSRHGTAQPHSRD